MISIGNGSAENAITNKHVDSRSARGWYIAITVVFGVGSFFWLAAGRLQSDVDIHPGAAWVVRLGMLLILMLSALAITTIRLTSIMEQHRRQLSLSREVLEERERQRGEADRRFQLMFSGHPCPMWICERTSLLFLDVNEAAVQQYGYSREEFLRMTIKEIRPQEEVPALVHDIDQFEGQHSSRGVWRHRRKDGSILFVEITALKYKKDLEVQYLVLANDVTKRVETEEELRKSKASLQSIIDNAPFGICRGSIHTDYFEMVNPALSQMLGSYPIDQLNKLHLSSTLYVDPKDRVRLLNLLRRDRKIRGFETSLFKRDGSRIRVRVTGTLLDEPNREGYFDAYIEDLTQQSSLEQQVRQIQKLEAVGRLAGGVAHDFNNILLVVKLSTEMMLREVTPSSPLTKPLLQVSKAADRGSALTRQMLAFGRQQMMQVRVLNLNTVVDDISRMLRRIIGEDIELVIKLSKNLANARLDSDQVGQVLLNLAVNARDAMPGGGSLHIETANVELDRAYIKEHPPVLPGSYVMLAVSDTGSGIEKSDIPHIFDPFFTTKEVGKGTGLGLSIVYGIVKQSGGYIWVYSELKRGTSFKIYFPATTAATEVAPTAVDGSGRISGKTVLVVDDEAEVRVNVRECLEQLGYRVYEAASGEQALGICQQQRGGIDLVLTDLVMPGLAGHELSNELAHGHPTVPVLFMSGYTEDNAARRAILQKGNPFLQKPFSVAELSRAVQQTMESSAVLPVACS